MRAPVALISQVQRSGGSLLSQLFDGHPAVAAYPHELRFGFSMADEWPRLDPRRSADENFRLLFDLKLRRLMQHGFSKGGDTAFSTVQGRSVKRQAERLRFFMVPRIQYLVFKHLCEADAPKSARDVLDNFFTAFFNAWLDYQGSLGNKTWITAFAPRLAHDEAHVAGFFATYPEGRLIQIIRDPRSWYASAKNHRKSLLDAKDADGLLAMWADSARSMQRNKSQYGDRVIIVSFEDLIGRTELTMRTLAEALAINFDPTLLAPTFNGVPARANSSFTTEQSGILMSPLARARNLSAAERDMIDRRYMKLYDSIAVEALVPTGTASEAQAYAHD